MKVKIKTWERMASEFGSNIEADYLEDRKHGIKFFKLLEKKLPHDRIIEVIKLSKTLFKYIYDSSEADGFFYISIYMIEYFIVDEDIKQYPLFATGGIVQQIKKSEPKSKKRIKKRNYNLTIR